MWYITVISVVGNNLRENFEDILYVSMVLPYSVETKFVYISVTFVQQMDD